MCLVCDLTPRYKFLLGRRVGRHDLLFVDKDLYERTSITEWGHALQARTQHSSMYPD